MSALEELSSIELQVSSAHKTQLSCFCVCIGMEGAKNNMYVIQYHPINSFY